MNRTGRFLGKLIVLLLIIAVAVVGFRAFTPFTDKHFELAARNFADMQGGWQQQQHHPAATRDWHQPERVQHRDWGGGNMMKMLVGLLLLVAGWKLWKRGSRGFGGALIAIALLPLLFMMIGLLFHLALVAVLIYIVWRCLRHTPRPCTTAGDTEYRANTVDFLDEWEAKTRRHINQKDITIDIQKEDN